MIHQYSSKWTLPLNLVAETSAWKPRPSRSSITPIGLRILSPPVSLFLYRHADHLRVAAQEHVRPCRIERFAQLLFQSRRWMIRS